MASSKEYLDFILEQLSGSEDISYRAMMGEYIIYSRGKVIGGIYDDRFLVKPAKSAAALMPDALQSFNTAILKDWFSGNKGYGIDGNISHEVIFPNKPVKAILHILPSLK